MRTRKGDGVVSLSLSRKYLLSYFNEYWERGQSREKKRFFKRVLTVARLLDRVCVEVVDENQRKKSRRPFSFEEESSID